MQTDKSIFLGKKGQESNFLRFFIAMAPFFRYISAHEIRSKHQLLVVAGPIIGAWYFWYGFQKEAGSSKGANFFAKTLETRQRT
jgi:hypothetical protein